MADFPDIRTGFGYDVHRFTAGDTIRLCGVDIPCGYSLSGHSDADAALHALTDALLGTIAAGDIGQHFPPSDPQWKGADSIVFLEHALKLVKQAGGHLNHIDLTLVCEIPKIGPHREKMRNRLAKILDLPESKVSVKATTTEKLGFAGRKEGLATYAVATVFVQKPIN